MKRIITLLAALACICSCDGVFENKVLDGRWEPMELDRQHLNFTSEGGEQVVVVLNYSRWWISGAYDYAKMFDGKLECWNYVHPTSSGGEETCTFDILDGGWYHVSVPDKGRSNTVIIKVDQNIPAKPRQAIIDMTAGDVFTSISIHQN